MKQIRHRRLRTGRHQRRMRIDDRRRSVEARIRDAPDAHLAVVVRHVLQQKIDRVVGVRRVVHVLRRFLVVDVRPHLQKLALAHPASAHILVDEDVAGLLELLRRPQVLRILVFAVRSDAVRSAVHQERIGTAGSVLGHIHRREQPLAVAHRNAVFVFGVVCADIVHRWGLSVSARLLRNVEVNRSQRKGNQAQFNQRVKRRLSIQITHGSTPSRRSYLCPSNLPRKP